MTRLDAVFIALFSLLRFVAYQPANSAGAQSFATASPTATPNIPVTHAVEATRAAVNAQKTLIAMETMMAETQTAITQQTPTPGVSETKSTSNLTSIFL